MAFRSWLGAGAGLASAGWGANQFASMIVLYRRDLGLSATATGAMFGLYAVGLVPGLLLGGRWSDRRGRRVVVVTGVIGCAVGSAVLMLGAADPAFLYAGRFITGLFAGLGFASGTAWVAELSGADGGGARRATIAMTAGFAAGPSISGLTAAIAPTPEVTAYLPHLVSAAIALPAVLRTPDRRPRADEDAALAPAPRVTALLRHFLAVQLALAPWVFGTVAVGIAFLPALVVGPLGAGALPFTALITGIAPLCALLTQPFAARIAVHGRRVAIGVAMAAVLLGLGVAATIAATRWFPGAVLSSILLGVGFGMTQAAGLRELQRVADPRILGIATAVYQVLTYVGFAFPFLLSGLQAVTGVGPGAAILALLGLAAICTLWLTVGLPRTASGRD